MSEKFPGDIWHYLGTELLCDFQNSFFDLIFQEQYLLYHYSSMCYLKNNIGKTTSDIGLDESLRDLKQYATFDRQKTR